MGTYKTLTLHWDGSNWTRVPSPSLEPNGNFVYDVAAVAPNDVWAVGLYGRSEFINETLVLHWDGQSWSIVPSANMGSASSALSGLAVVAADNIWAVGAYLDNGFRRTLILHWDGTTWSVVPSPQVGKYHSTLRDIAAISANDIWAVGYYNSTTNLTQHWDGVKWQVVDSPTIGKYNGLNGVSAVSSTDVWAVGHYEAAVVLHEHYSTDCPPPSATPTLTPTATPTYTVGPTFTPTIVPTPCSLMFVDVPLDQPFYPYIRCLSCRVIISGYADGTFRPNNYITRSQIAKMVSNAAGFSEEAGDQIYEDVDPSHPFYVWINRLSRRAVMGGYPCSSVPEEPCNLPDSRPYFRPFANTTRSQLAKIVSNAAGLNVPPKRQAFADVPSGSNFYVWIQRLADLGVIGGYPCGGENEPCDEEYRPYFRPYSNVTRGQTSKIVSETFFPNCQTPVRR